MWKVPGVHHRENIPIKKGSGGTINEKYTNPMTRLLLLFALAGWDKI
jgi:hypothetical protein